MSIVYLYTKLYMCNVHGIEAAEYKKDIDPPSFCIMAYRPMMQLFS